MYTHKLPNMYDGVMHNHDLVWWEKNPHLIWTRLLNYVGCKLERSHMIIRLVDTHGWLMKLCLKISSSKP